MKTIVVGITLLFSTLTVYAQVNAVKVGTVSGQTTTESPHAIFIVGQPFVGQQNKDTVIAGEIGFLPLSKQYQVSVSESTENVFRLAAFPNPTTGIVRVHYETDGTLVDWKLVDAQGRTVKHGQTTANVHEFSVDMSGLANGTFSLNISQKQKSSTLQLVLVK